MPLRRHRSGHRGATLLAVIEDTLNTVLRLVGAGAYIGQLNQVAQAHQRLAAAQANQARVQMQIQAQLASGATFTPRMAGALGMAAGGAGQAGGALSGSIAAAAFVVIAEAITSSVAALAEYDRELIRTQAFQKELGHSLPTKEIEEFTRNLSLETGVAQTEILKTQDYLARYGLEGKMAERTSVDLARASQATGRSMVDLAQAIEMARRGRARELFRELGIPIRGVTDQMYSFDQLMQLVNLHTKDMQIAFGNSLPGALDRTAAAFQDMALQFGKLIEPATVAWLKNVRDILAATAEEFKALGEHRWMDFLRGTSMSELQKKLGGGGSGGESTGERYLRKIEYNTGPQGPLGRATRGGGAFSEPGGGLRIRDFNGMLRKHT